MCTVKLCADIKLQYFSLSARPLSNSFTFKCSRQYNYRLFRNIQAIRIDMTFPLNKLNTH